MPHAPNVPNVPNVPKVTNRPQCDVEPETRLPGRGRRSHMILHGRTATYTSTLSADVPAHRRLPQPRPRRRKHCAPRGDRPSATRSQRGLVLRGGPWRDRLSPLAARGHQSRFGNIYDGTVAERWARDDPVRIMEAAGGSSSLKRPLGRVSTKRQVRTLMLEFGSGPGRDALFAIGAPRRTGRPIHRSHRGQSRLSHTRPYRATQQLTDRGSGVASQGCRAGVTRSVRWSRSAPGQQRARAVRQVSPWRRWSASSSAGGVPQRLKWSRRPGGRSAS